MKKILITGSHGFLARNTAFLLKKKSYKVYGIGNGKWNKKQYQKWGYDYLVNKEVNFKNLLKNFYKFDYIIHCAGSGTVGLPFRKDFKKNVTPTKSILKFIRLRSPKSKIIFLSSYSVYGKKYHRPIKETFKLDQYPITGSIKNLLKICVYIIQKNLISICLLLG